MSLVLQMKFGDRVLIGDAVVQVVKRSGTTCTFLIDAPSTVKIIREKVLTKHGVDIMAPKARLK